MPDTYVLADAGVKRAETDPRPVAETRPGFRRGSSVRSTTPARPSAAIHAWPMEHPIVTSLVWSIALIALIALIAPLAAVLFRRRTRD
jgi:hypothetical protein